MSWTNERRLRRNKSELSVKKLSGRPKGWKITQTSQSIHLKHQVTKKTKNLRRTMIIQMLRMLMRRQKRARMKIRKSKRRRRSRSKKRLLWILIQSSKLTQKRSVISWTRLYARFCFSKTWRRQIPKEIWTLPSNWTKSLSKTPLHSTLGRSQHQLTSTRERSNSQAITSTRVSARALASTLLLSRSITYKSYNSQRMASKTRPWQSYCRDWMSSELWGDLVTARTRWDLWRPR